MKILGRIDDETLGPAEPLTDKEIADLRAVAHKICDWPVDAVLATIDALRAERDAAVSRCEALREVALYAVERLSGYQGRTGVENTFACSYAEEALVRILDAEPRPR